MKKKKKPRLNPEALAICQLAEDDFQKAVANPIWQSLFNENPQFARDLPSQFKLLLLKSIYSKWGQLSVPDELLESESEAGQTSIVGQALESLSDIDVDIDPWETEWPGVTYSSDDVNLEQGFDIGHGWSVDILFNDCDIEMKDVDYGCDERIDSKLWLEALFADPDMDIRAFADECGLSYQPSMSPESGDRFRFAGIRLSSSSGDAIELEAHDLEDFFERGQELAHLLETQSGVLQANQLEMLASLFQCPQPIFDGAPEVDAETSEYSDDFEWYSPEGKICLTWKCNCWLPLPSLTGMEKAKPAQSDLHRFVKQPIDIVFDAHGNSEGSYEVAYSYKSVSDAKDEILKSLDDDRLDSICLYALGLSHADKQG